MATSENFIEYVWHSYSTPNDVEDIELCNRRDEFNGLYTGTVLERASSTEWDPAECQVTREDDQILRQQIEAAGLSKEARIEFELGFLDQAL